LSARIIDHFVQDHTTIFTKDERTLVRKDNTDRTALTCFDLIALENSIARTESYFRIISTRNFDATFNGFNGTNRFDLSSPLGLSYLHIGTKTRKNSSRITF